MDVATRLRGAAVFLKTPAHEQHPVPARVMRYGSAASPSEDSHSSSEPSLTPSNSGVEK